MESLRNILFPDDGEDAYALIDGASCEELLPKLREHHPDHVCLYAGELAADVQKVAPYLVALPPEHPFTDWLLDNGFGKHWGIFARSAAGLRALRKHFRTFLRVRSPEGKMLLFRYYDPRVLHTYLPTCEAKELAAVFGPVHAYVYEEMKTPCLVRSSFHQGRAENERITLSVPREGKG